MTMHTPGRAKSLRYLLFMIAAAILAGCSQANDHSEASARRIGYSLWLNTPPENTAAVPPFDTINHAVARLFARMQKNTVVHAAWSEWPTDTLQAQMCSQLVLHPGARMYVVGDSDRFRPHGIEALDDGRRMRAYAESNPGQLLLQNDDDPGAGVLRPHARLGRMRNNFMLFEHLAPSGVDDGDFGILFCVGAFEVLPPPFPAVHEAIWIHGDSSLFERFLGYWHTIVDGQSELLSAQSHTYSNLHDHLAWFFPDLHAEDAANAILQPLETGLEETHQPAKLRLALSGIDACHLDFARALKAMQQRFQLDVKVVLAPHDDTDQRVVEVFSDLPAGSLRFFPEMDSANIWRMNSNFLLIDGPYPMTETAPADAIRLSFFFGDKLNISGLRHNSGTWLRIKDQSIFEDTESHFDAIWEMCVDTVQVPMLLEHGKVDCR